VAKSMNGIQKKQAMAGIEMQLRNATFSVFSRLRCLSRSRFFLSRHTNSVKRPNRCEICRAVRRLSPGAPQFRRLCQMPSTAQISRVDLLFRDSEAEASGSSGQIRRIFPRSHGGQFPRILRNESESEAQTAKATEQTESST
jgi:hypothetical protein